MVNLRGTIALSAAVGLVFSAALLAQKKDDKNLYLEAASAYEKYLSLFRPKQYATQMMQNRADALFAARRFPEAARQFEELALYLDTHEAEPHTPRQKAVCRGRWDSHNARTTRHAG